jgi:hypothetical protein
VELQAATVGFPVKPAAQVTPVTANPATVNALSSTASKLYPSVVGRVQASQPDNVYSPPSVVQAVAIAFPL